MSCTCSGAPAPVSKPLFPLGRILATPGALYALGDASVSLQSLLDRHAQGDWGDLDHEDVCRNREALVHGLRLMSNYPLSDGGRIWIITEADRSVTTLLLPEDY